MLVTWNPCAREQDDVFKSYIFLNHTIFLDDDVFQFATGCDMTSSIYEPNIFKVGFLADEASIVLPMRALRVFR